MSVLSRDLSRTRLRVQLQWTFISPLVLIPLVPVVAKSFRTADCMDLGAKGLTAVIQTTET